MSNPTISSIRTTLAYYDNLHAKNSSSRTMRQKVVFTSSDAPERYAAYVFTVKGKDGDSDKIIHTVSFRSLHEQTPGSTLGEPKWNTDEQRFLLDSIVEKNPELRDQTVSITKNPSSVRFINLDDIFKDDCVKWAKGESGAY